jgi:tetratricopeptide (TPR) repeat protein
MGAYGTAIGCYLNALRYKPDYAAAWWGLGSSYARSGNRSAALEAVKELRRYDPKEAEKLFNLIMKPEQELPIPTPGRYAGRRPNPFPEGRPILLFHEEPQC